MVENALKTKSESGYWYTAFYTRPVLVCFTAR